MTGQAERVPTGVAGLDAALGGGLRVGSLAVVVGSTMSGRDVLAQQFFAHGLAKGEAAVYVTTKDFADDVFARLAELGFDGGSHKGSYKLIDAYSTQSDPTIQDLEDVTYVPSIADFAKLSNAVISTMSSFMTEGHHRQRLAFDSLDTVLMYVNAQGVFRLLSYLRAKVKAFGAARGARREDAAAACGRLHRAHRRRRDPRDPAGAPEGALRLPDHAKGRRRERPVITRSSRRRTSCPCREPACGPRSARPSRRAAGRG
jgi:archaellum biogenesis ATPase FlaH